jgi:hypothetical protein
MLRPLLVWKLLSLYGLRFREGGAKGFRQSDRKTGKRIYDEKQWLRCWAS